MRGLFSSRRLKTESTSVAFRRPLNILVIEDNEHDYRLFLRECSKSDLLINAVRVDTHDSLSQALFQKPWDLIVSDNNLPGGHINIASSLSLARSILPSVPFVVVSGTITDDQAIAFMDLGANDYVLKDNLVRVVPTIRKILNEQEYKEKKVEAENKLVESNERFRVLAESIKDMFFAMDANFTCIYWNATAERMTAIPAMHALGKNVYELFPALKGEELERKFLQSITRMEPVTTEFNLEHDQMFRYLQVSIYPSPDVYSVIIKDVTRTRRIEEKLKDTDQELETFLYRISHDIRGPIASLLGLINLARIKDFETMLPELFNQAEHVAKRLDEIVKGLSAITQIKKEPVECEEVSIRDVVLWVEPRLVKRERTVSIRVETTTSEMLFTDPNLIELILEKMMQNAIDYASPEREPEILVTLRHEHAGYVQLVCRDNGIGIPDQIVDKIFTMFYRGSAFSRGSGLGLYLVKSAVDELKGYISVKSQTDSGTVFSLYLPQRNSPAFKPENSQ